MDYYNYHYGQVALAIVLLVGIAVIVKPSLFVYIPKYLKYRFYSRRKMVKCYVETTKPLIKRYNEIVDLIATKRREADDNLYKSYKSMIEQGVPEYMAQQAADEMNRQAIEMYDKLIQESLIPVRDSFVKKHNSVTASMKEIVENLDNLFGIKNGYMPFKML